jgi:predicted DNA-binding mobile mystery protein A
MTSAEQLDRRFKQLKPLISLAKRPEKGWIRAIRTALGMSTGQLAARMNVTQPRITELETAETQGNITVKSLERAAQAMGCRVVYMLVPEHPLQVTLQERARTLAERQFASIQQTMRLEDQAVSSKTFRSQIVRQTAEKLLLHPSRLWKEPDK